MLLEGFFFSPNNDVANKFFSPYLFVSEQIEASFIFISKRIVVRGFTSKQAPTGKLC